MTADTDTLEHPGNAREWLTILGMIVPLTHEEAVERAHRLAGLPEDASLSEGVPHFACRHWDEETRLCTIYDQRPWMCRTYPSVKCGHGCGRPVGNHEFPAGLPGRGLKFGLHQLQRPTHQIALVLGLLEFFDAVRGLGNKLGPVLVQLPPKLAFDDGIAQEFFTTLRELHPGAVVLEPRHPSWFTASVDRLLRSFEIARVAADPPTGSKLAARPGGWQGPFYWRLHGAPRTYYSEYDEKSMQAFAHKFPLAVQRIHCPNGHRELDSTNSARWHARPREGLQLRRRTRT